MIILLDLTQLGKGIIEAGRECFHRKQNPGQRGTKMRKVRNTGFSNNNPALMFARGVEQIVSDHMAKHPQYDDQALPASQRSPEKQQNNGSLFSILIQQLFWQNRGRQA